MAFDNREMQLFFPTPVWSAILTDAEAINERIRERLETMDWDELEEENKQKYGRDHTFREDRFITVEQIPETREILDGFIRLCGEIAAYVKWNLGGMQLHITDYWYHVTEPGEVTQTHSHKPALLSGVYYVDKPEDSGHLVFIDQNPYHGYLPPVSNEESNPLMAAEVVVPAVEGAIVIFPSWLHHRVQRNDSGKRRVSISFNAAPLPAGARG